MKQFLLSATLLTSLTSFGQFTQANEPQVGTSVLMYILDSNAVNFSSLTGAAQTWDYSTTSGYTGQTKTISVVSPASTAYAADYPGTTFATDIPGFITSYYTSTASARNSKGFVFDAGSFGGTVIVKLTGDDELVMNYPFALGNTLTDAFSGNSDVMGTDYPTTGTVTTTVDGTGTLKLNAATTISNVTRFKMADQATVTIPLIGTVVMDRTQYEYYDLANSSLPVFVHATLVITLAGSPTTQHIVMSSVAPDEYLAVNETEKVNFQMYPNPATSSVTLGGLTGNETIQIVDMSGRVIMTTQATSTSTTIALDGLKGGIYSVMVNNSVQRLTIK